MRKKIKKSLVTIIGFIVLITGVILIPYPGPGWLVVFAGLGILSAEYKWARRLLDYAKGKYDDWTHWVTRQNRLIQSAIWLVTATIVVVTIWLLNGYGMINDFLQLNLDWVRSPFFGAN